METLVVGRSTVGGASYDEIDMLLGPSQGLSDEDYLDLAKGSGTGNQSRGLSDRQVASVLFNETRSFSAGPDPSQLTQGRVNVAHAIINGDEYYQATGHARPAAAPTVANVPLQEQAAFNACLDAVNEARVDQVLGIDPTNGAMNFNFRNNAWQGNFMGLPISTSNGPVVNGYFGGGLGPSVYINTYR